MHYFIIFIIIAGIVIWQLSVFKDTLDKLITFNEVFSEDDRHLDLYIYETGEVRINSNYDNPVWATILKSINNYLINNKGAVSDFHLIKDIVERNCEAKEEEINTQIPVPLYLGLVGTMAGILVGVGFLWISGGLASLLSSATANGAEGVEALLGGVAMAMISSIIGILLTTWGSLKGKNCKAEVEQNKNTFLSWIQANLLPKLSDGTAAIMEKVSLNLGQFNATFSQNTREMSNAFASVKNIYKDLSDVLTAINQMKIKELAKYNILVYDRMRNSAEEIGILGEQLKGVNQYLSATNNVVQKLDLVFDREISQFDQRIGAIKKAVGEIDNGINRSLSELTINSKNNLDTFIKSSSDINEKFSKAAEDQQNTLQEAIIQQSLLFEQELTKQESNFNNLLEKQNKALAEKSKEIESIVAELQNLSAVKSGIGSLEKTAKEQNKELIRLTHAIEKLAQLKLNEGGVINPWNGIPRGVKITGFAIAGSVAFSGLFFLVLEVLKLATILH